MIHTCDKGESSTIFKTFEKNVQFEYKKNKKIDQSDS